MELKAYLTAAGSAVVAKLLASQGALEFTRAELGSGSVSSEAAARARTSLVGRPPWTCSFPTPRSPPT